MDSSPGVGRAHREDFKLGMKEDGDEMRLDRDKPGGAVPGLRGRAMVRLK